MYYLYGAPGTYSLHIAGALGCAWTGNIAATLVHQTLNTITVVQFTGILSQAKVLYVKMPVRTASIRTLITLLLFITVPMAFNKTIIGSHGKGQDLLKNYYEHMRTMYKEARKTMKLL